MQQSNDAIYTSKTMGYAQEKFKQSYKMEVKCNIFIDNLSCKEYTAFCIYDWNRKQCYNWTF